MAGLRAELGTELLGSLSPAERREMPTLNPELERLRVRPRGVGYRYSYSYTHPIPALAPAQMCPATARDMYL